MEKTLINDFKMVKAKSTKADGPKYIYKVYEILPDESLKLLGMFRYQRHAKAFLNYLEQGHR
jgi:hypothetical protein